MLSGQATSEVRNIFVTIISSSIVVIFFLVESILSLLNQNNRVENVDIQYFIEFFVLMS